MIRSTSGNDEHSDCRTEKPGNIKQRILGVVLGVYKYLVLYVHSLERTRSTMNGTLSRLN